MELLSLSLQDYPSEVDMKYPVFLVAAFNFSAVLLDRHPPHFDYNKITWIFIGSRKQNSPDPPPPPLQEGLNGVMAFTIEIKIFGHFTATVNPK